MFFVSTAAIPLKNDACKQRFNRFETVNGRASTSECVKRCFYQVWAFAPNVKNCRMAALVFVKTKYAALTDAKILSNVKVNIAHV